MINRKWLRPANLPVITMFMAWLCLGVWVSPARPDDDGDDWEGRYVPGEVVIKLARSSDLSAIAAKFRLDPTPLDQFGSRPIYRMRIIDGAPAPMRARQLAFDSLRRVVYAEPNYMGQAPEGGARVIWAHGGDSGTYVSQWARYLIRLPEAHGITRGAGVTVAVLDTGVDLKHPALAGRLISGYDFVDMDADPSEEGAYVRNIGYGHGTHVAGLIAMAAPEAKIMPVRVLDPDGVGNIWVLAEALAFAVNPDGNPATNDGADVINLSLGTLRHTQLISDLITDAANGDAESSIGYGDDDDDVVDNNSTIDDGLGVVVIAAAGNRSSYRPEFPAAEDSAGLLSVAASTVTDTLATFSNRGSWVRVAAPGEMILSSVPGGLYGTWNGTSMAAPLVAGEAALLRARYPKLKSAEVVNLIIQTAKRINGPVPRRIDAAAALGLRR